MEKEIEGIREELLLGKRASDLEGEKVMKVKDKEDFIRILAQELGEAKNNIIAFADFEKEHTSLLKAMEKIKKGNVKVKMLHATSHEKIKEYEKHKVESKHFEHGLNAFIIDDKKVVLALSDLKKEKPEYYFTIWNHKPMVDVLKNHFEACWDKGKNV